MPVFRSKESGKRRLEREARRREREEAELTLQLLNEEEQNREAELYYRALEKAEALKPNAYGGRSNARRVRANSTTLRNLASVKITRNRDGTVGIVARRNAPVTVGRKRNAPKRGNPRRLSDKTEGYMVYPGGYRFWSLVEANKEAKAESKTEDNVRVQGVYTERIISKWRGGKRQESNPRRPKRRNAPKKRKNFSLSRLKQEYARQREAGSGRVRSLKRAVRTTRYNRGKRPKR